MARQRLIDAPPRNDVYAGMLGLTCLAMLAGIVVLLLEFGGDYDFEQQAKAGPAVSLPKDYSRPTPKPDGTAPAPTPVAAPTTKADPLPAAPALPPEPPKPAVAAAAPTLPIPLPASVLPPVTVSNPVTPAAEPTVVRPGFNPRFPR